MDLSTVLSKIVGGEPSKKMVVVVLMSAAYLFGPKLGIDPSSVEKLINWLILPWLLTQGGIDAIKVLKTGQTITPVVTELPKN